MFRNDDRRSAQRVAIALAASALILCGHARAGENAENAPGNSQLRSYESSVSILGETAISFDISSPRIPASELEKVLSAPRVLATLNQKHLSGLGQVTVARACRIGPVFLDPGAYQLGLSIGADRQVELILTSASGASTIPLTSAATAGSVPVVTVALLPSDEIEGFAIEVRVGKIRGVTPVDFSSERLIVAMNNTAHDLLNPEDVEGRIDAQAAALALQLANRANSMTAGGNSMILDTYALALFHSGKVKQAITTQRLAIQQLEAGKKDARPGMVARLRAYQLANAK